MALSRVWVFTIAAAIPFGSAHSQCDMDWLTTDGLPGLDGHVYATTVWDPDGAGPAEELLVAGGRFAIAGTTIASTVAGWNGTSWQAFGTGLGGHTDATVFALSVVDGELIAAGDFTETGGRPINHIARWDGQTWQPLGDGLNGTVRALAAFNGELIAAGSIFDIGGSAFDYIGKWNGSSWQPLGNSVDGSVNALLVHNGVLFVGGEFVHAGGIVSVRIAQWDGVGWQAYGAPGLANVVHALAVYNDQLMVGSGSLVGFWNGEWQLAGQFNNIVYALSQYGNDLFAGGAFSNSSPGGQALNHVARWSGAGPWQPVSGGMGGGDVRCLMVHDQNLVAGGQFAIAGGQAASRIARWNGTSFSALGTGFNSTVRAVTSYNDDLIAGGSFLMAGDASVKQIARWDGSSWHTLGTGMSGPLGAQVYALAVYGPDLIAAGHFTTAGGALVNHIALWNGTSWSALGTGVSYFSPNDCRVTCLTVFNGELIAGGQFNNAGGVNVPGLAKWNGISWSPVSGPQDPSPDALAVFDGNLIAAGGFSTAGGVTVNNIARWDGTAWHPLGSGIGGFVEALAVYKSELIVGGNFNMAGGASVNNIARWNGTSWQGLGSGVTGDAFEEKVLALTVLGDELIAAGGFTTAGGIDVNRIARWDTSSWQPLGNGLNSFARGFFQTRAECLTVHNGDLIVSGAFHIAGDNVSAYLARWGAACPLGDITHDGAVDVSDLLAVINGWGACPPVCPADVNEDGVVDVSDLLLVINNWS